MNDYEQLYYDVLYENRKLKNEIAKLKEEIEDLNICRTKKNIDLQKYIIRQLKKRSEIK